MGFKSYDQLHNIVERNQYVIREAVEKKFGHQDCNVRMDFAFADKKGTEYHCLTALSKTGSDVKMFEAYGFNGNEAIRLTQNGREIMDDAEGGMSALADAMEMHGGADAICIDLTRPDPAYETWDPEKYGLQKTMRRSPELLAATAEMEESANNMVHPEEIGLGE